jgi:hypothetical protein
MEVLALRLQTRKLDSNRIQSITDHEGKVECEGDWTRVTVMRNVACTCAESLYTPNIEFSSYTRIGTFLDGRVYLTNGDRYIAQLRPDVDSAWSHFGDEQFSIALGFPSQMTDRYHVLWP